MTMSGGKNDGGSSGGGNIEISSGGNVENSSHEVGESGSSFEIGSVTEAKSGGAVESFEIDSVRESSMASMGSEFEIESVAAASKDSAVVTGMGTEITGPAAETAGALKTERTEEKIDESLTEKEPVTEPKASLGTVETKEHMAETLETTETFEKKSENALKEINLREYTDETLEQVEDECAAQMFRNGEGKEIAKAEAVNEMIGDLDSVLDSLREEGREITAEQKQAVLEDVRRSVYSQEAESQSRGIGSHGVSHIYGVYERVRDIPDEVLEQAAENVRERAPESNATAADMRAALIVAAAYHDEGYLAEQARRGPGKDGLHGVDSAIAFEHKHSVLLDGIVDKAVQEDVRRAMAEHNVLPETSEAALRKAGVEEKSPVRQEVLEEVVAEGRADMDPNKNFVRSALLLSDKLAVDADEKMPDVLRDEERAGVMVLYYQQKADRISEDERAQLMARIKQDGLKGEIASAELAKQEKELLAEKNAGKPEEMKQQLSEMVRSDKSLSEERKARYLAAIEKDINPGAGGFDLPMTGVTTPSTALQFSVVEENGEKHIEVEATIHHRMDDPIYLESFGDKTGPEISKPPEGKKVRGAFEDLGITEETLQKETGRTVDELMMKEDEETSVVRTEGIHGLEHVTLKVKRIDPETVKGDVNETVAAIEAQAEAERGRVAEQEIRQEAISSFREDVGHGVNSVENVLTLCGAIYEGNETQVQAIISQIQENPDMAPEDVKELTDRCLALCEAEETSKTA